MSPLRSSAAAAAFAMMTVVVAPAQPANPDADPNRIGYPTAPAAYVALRARKDLGVTTQAGWIVFSDKAKGITWSFTPTGHPAHPAVVKRTLIEKDGGFYVASTGLCTAEKAVCDRMMAEFSALDKRMRESAERKRPRRAPAN
jgi:hypothetical protein